MSLRRLRLAAAPVALSAVVLAACGSGQYRHEQYLQQYLQQQRGEQPLEQQRQQPEQQERER